MNLAQTSMEASGSVSFEEVVPSIEVESFVGQAVDCGGWSLAFNLQWSNLIIDEFEIVRIPRAPDWLIGAVNVDGVIVPVVDLSVYFVPNAAPANIGRQHRLLMGGQKEGNEGAAQSENAFAILFAGLPMQIQYTRVSMDDAFVIPERLREICLGMAKSSTGKSYFEMNTDRLIEFLSMSLI